MGHWRAHLSSSQGFRPLVDLHPSQTHANGPRGDNDNFVAIFDKSDDSLDDEGQDGEEGLVRFFMNDRACTCICEISTQSLLTNFLPTKLDHDCEVFLALHAHLEG